MMKREACISFVQFCGFFLGEIVQFCGCYCY
jgi:hypothetical protein